MTFQHWFWSTSTPKLWIKVVTSYLCSVFPTFPYSPHGQSSTTKKSWWVCIDPVGLRAQDLLCQEDSQFIWILILPDIKRIVYDSIVPYHHETDGVLNTVQHQIINEIIQFQVAIHHGTGVQLLGSWTCIVKSMEMVTVQGIVFHVKIWPTTHLRGFFPKWNALSPTRGLTPLFSWTFLN